MITRKTLVREVVAAGLDPRSVPLSDIAEPPHYTLDASLPLEDGFHMLEELDLERVPVVESARLVGVLSRAVVQRRLAEDEPPAVDLVDTNSRCMRRAGRRPRPARQLCGRERDAVEQVVLADYDLVEPVRIEDGHEDAAPATMTGARSGSIPGRPRRSAMLIAASRCSCSRARTRESR